MDKALIVLLFVVLAAGLAFRITGPSDLYDNDQPRTVSYTIDMMQSGQWALPQDMLGRPATKPQAYNWLGVACVKIFGVSEWSLRLPAILCGLTSIGLTIWMCVVLFRYWPKQLSLDVQAIAGKSNAVHLSGWHIGLVAGAFWLANPMGLKMIYLARPDGILVAFLTGAWCFGTLALFSERGRSMRWAMAFWLCVAGAGLSKGVPAVLPLIYVVITAKLFTGQWLPLKRLHTGWGLPLCLAIIAGWLYAAWLQDPAGFRHTLLADLLEHDSVRQGPLSWMVAVLLDIWHMPAQYFARFAPWSLFAVLAALHVPWRQWRKHPVGPALLWGIIIIGTFMLYPRQRPDYLAPMLAPSAILAAYWLLVVGIKYHITPRRAMTAALIAVTAIGIVYYHNINSASLTQLGQNTYEFVQTVREHTNNELIAFINTGYNPLQSLLGENQPKPPDDTPWIITPVEQWEGTPVIVSKPIPQVDLDNDRARPLGLYPR